MGSEHTTFLALATALPAALSPDLGLQWRGLGACSVLSTSFSGHSGSARADPDSCSFREDGVGKRRSFRTTAKLGWDVPGQARRWPPFSLKDVVGWSALCAVSKGDAVRSRDQGRYVWSHDAALGLQ